MNNYTETKLGITKDGHTMFRFDIVQDLNRKSHLEDLTVEQQQQINKFLELNASLNSQAVRQVAMYNERVVENNELKAMVNALRDGLGFYADCGHYKISDGRDVMIMDHGEKAEGALKQTRTQSLVSIQQQAIKDAIANSEKVEFEGSHYVGTFVSLEDLEVNIKQLGDKS